MDQLQCIEDQGIDDSYEVVSDIDASETSSWNDGAGFDPIASAAIGSEFSGTLDGNGSTVTGLTINRPETDSVGLFAGIGDTDLEGGKMTDLIVEDADVEGNSTVGIIAGGTSTGSDINRSSASGTVTGSSFVGGIAGSMEGLLSNSSSTADVSGATDVGGLVGLSNGGVVVNSYARGNVDADDTAGGLVGFSGTAGVVQRSYATGTVSADLNAGGVLGINIPSIFGDPIKDNYWDTESTSQSIPGGSEEVGATGLTTSEMTGSAAESSMSSLDFTDTWETVPGDYPILSWQSQSDNQDGGGSGGVLEDTNPFGGPNNEPLGPKDASDVLFEWNTNNGVVDGQSIPKSDMADFLFRWNQAR